jgi:hypothetical protein
MNAEEELIVNLWSCWNWNNPEAAQISKEWHKFRARCMEPLLAFGLPQRSDEWWDIILKDALHKHGERMAEFRKSGE